MNYNFENTNWDFVQHRRIYFLISAGLIILGMLLIAIVGLNLGVDFVGGTKLEVLLEGENFTENDVQEIFEENGFPPGGVRLVGNDNEIAEVTFDYILDQQEIAQTRQFLADQFATFTAGDLSEHTVDPLIARELARQAVWGILLASLGVIAYVAFRFEYRYGVAAIIALFHDALFVIALFAVLRLEVDLTFIAAVLTVVGYSINDTIVIFDRIRENTKFAKLKTEKDVSELVNRSIRESLPRSINTSLTVLFVVTCLYLFGGEGIRNFSLALFAGLIAGTYSSLFIAAQVWMIWKTKEVKQKTFDAQAKES